MRILITGGTGFLGGALCAQLLRQGHELTMLSRQPHLVFTRHGGRVRALRRLADLTLRDTFDAVINLAGESLVEQPWSHQRKLELYTSRVNLTEELVDWLRRAKTKPHLLLSASAVGWYGDQGDSILDEDSPAHENGYMHRLCQDWERAALAAEALGIRVCLLRTGLVLGRRGGLLYRLVPLFGFHLGGRFGNGRQWLAWIGLHDWLAAVQFLLLSADLDGVFNLTAPQPVTNADFTDTLARLLRRKALLWVPETVLRLLMGEMAALVLDSQRVLPSRLLAAGFSFRAASLAKALSWELALRDADTASGT